jgi:hypothetical protein
MSYTILVDGVPIQCDTASAAIALAREAAASGSSVTAPSTTRHDSSATPSSVGRWTEQRIRDFFKLIKPQQRKLIDALLETPDGRTTDQLCQILGLANGMALAGVFAGVFKNARKVGADPKDLYVRKSAIIADNRQFEYTLTEGFRSAAKKWRP